MNLRNNFVIINWANNSYVPNKMIPDTKTIT